MNTGCKNTLFSFASAADRFFLPISEKSARHTVAPILDSGLTHAQTVAGSSIAQWFMISLAYSKPASQTFFPLTPS